MNCFWETVETMPDNIGFTHFDMCHILWLVGFLVFTVLVSVVYKKSSQRLRKIIRITLVSLLLADELFKMAGLIFNGNYIPKYLPLQLCSINIFLILVQVIKSGKTVNNFLYTVCIPAALAALIFPTWTELPPTNFMHIHSFTVHILLAAYPIVLTVGGDIKPEIRQIPKTMFLLIIMAIPVYFINLMFDTNFMFLMYAESGNPLMWFETAFGSHLIGFPVLIIAILAVMYLPIYIKNRIKSKSA